LDPTIKKAFQAVIFALMYVILFLILLPPVINLLDERAGKVLYGLLVAGAVGVAFRLRFLSQYWK
jgi:F0F1-type ATP synthase membrane subunit b/b'